MLALDLLANGLIYGCFYALMAVGLAMIFGVLKVVNFAHGEFFMIGAYTYVLVAPEARRLALARAAAAPHSPARCSAGSSSGCSCGRSTPATRAGAS